MFGFYLTAASAGVFLHAGIKFPWFVFFQKDSGLRPKDPPFNMKISMIIFSAICHFNWNISLCFILSTSIQSRLCSLYIWSRYCLSSTSFIRWFSILYFTSPNEKNFTISLDTDWLYRNIGLKLVNLFSKEIKILIDGIKGGTPEQISSFIDI